MTVFSVCFLTQVSILSDLQCLLLGEEGQLIGLDVAYSLNPAKSRIRDRNMKVGASKVIQNKAQKGRKNYGTGEEQSHSSTF